MTLKEELRNRASAKFKVGDVIRSKRPYWGEPAYEIVGECSDGFHGVWTGSKHGPEDKAPHICRHLISWWDFETEETMDGPFEKCGVVMRAWLWLLGNTYGALRLK